MKTEDRLYIQELPDGGYRKCTAKEIAKAKTKAARREKLEIQLANVKQELRIFGTDCTHPVCWDEPGPIYNVRHCLICGHQSHL